MTLWVFMGIFVGMKLFKPKRVSTEVLNLISELEGFNSRWVTTQALAPDRLAALRQVATIESVGSSTRIEGVKLTNIEIESLLRGVKTFSFRSRDEQEVGGYAEVMETIFTSHKEIPVSENHIKQLHGMLLKYSTKDERHRGDYKKFPNHVEAFSADGKSQGVIFHTAAPFDTPKLMKDLVEWTSDELTKKELHSLLVIGIFVVTFLRIHPFQDGNGRLSRALTTLLLLKQGYAYVPYSSLERVIEENKDGYYLALRRGQAELEGEKPGGMEDWLLFFLRSMQKQKSALEKKLNSELSASKLPPLSLQIVEFIRSRGPTSISEAVSITGANRNTVKVHFRRLVKDGHLVAEGVGRGVRYRMKT
jgi:Fic family protein